MWNWWTLRRDRTTGRTSHRTTLHVEALEDREVPAVLIQIDYSLDTGFFTNNAAARAVMEQVASELGSTISANLSALTPSGGNTWTANFTNPTTGAAIAIPNLTIGANTIKVFVGAGALGSGQIGWGTVGGLSASGAPDWVGLSQTRGWSGYSPWGGSIEFDNRQNWYFGSTTAGLSSSQYDFYSVAYHELGRVLGIGTSNTWFSLSSGGAFHGATAMALYGGPVPETATASGWADGVVVNGQQASMDPAIGAGERVPWTSLDAAALRDLGWGPAGAGLAPLAAAVVAAPAPVSQPIVVASGGTVSLVVAGSGAVKPTGAQVVPFAGYAAGLTVATGDFNGDGTLDFAVTPAIGGPAVVEIINGRDGSLLVGQTNLLPGYTGGLDLAAGDIDGDGKAELIVGVGAGLPPAVATYRVNGGGLQQESAFIAFNANWFTGGVRVAAGDMNRDGYADVVVTTASMVGAVAIYSGAELRHGSANYLFAPFVPAPGLPVGLSAAVGDMDGDGFADLALTFGRGGPAFVAVWSGAELSRNPNTPASQLPTISAFLALPPSDVDGARLALRDLDGDGKADLVVASGNRLNPVVGVFSTVLGSSMSVSADPYGNGIDVA